MSVSIETLPRRIFTNGYGNSTRLRVDDAETEFYDGRDIRAVKEWSDPLGTSIPSGQRQLYQVTVAVNTIIVNTEYNIDNGQIRVTTHTGGTPTGSFVNNMSIYKTNTTTVVPAYTIQNSISFTNPGTSGTVDITGSTQLGIVRVKSAGSTAQAISVGNAPDSKLGIGPGTYYILVENIGTGVVEGTFRLRWWESTT